MTQVKGDSKKLQEIFNSKSQLKELKCRVCQRGALMLSQVRLGNDMDSNDAYRCSGDNDNLKGFNVHSFDNIEKEYERSWYNHPYLSRTREKMANILCNILVNGDFNTRDKTDYLVHSKP